MKILISDKLADAGLKILTDTPGLNIINQPGLGKDPDKLKKAIASVDAVIIRSGTRLTADVLDKAQNLKVIGRAGIGVDNIDVAAASKMGIIVMNTPGGNVVTTAEHAISLMCSLSRKIPQANASLKAGRWEKSKFMGTELKAKVLGIVGCGKIGAIVASRAKGLEMKVIVFDPFLTDERAGELDVQKVAFDELLNKADYITIHAPLNEKTRHMINKEAFGKMKRGVYVINCARGGIVKEDDLAWALKEGIVAGAALDVFEQEPLPADHPLLKFDNVIVTPHLGASTEEAQANVSLEVAKQVADFLVSGNVVNAVNAPSASAEDLERLGPWINLGSKLGLILGQLCRESPRQIQIDYYGELATEETAAITTSILKGILEPMLSDLTVNVVNAPFLARERGMTVKESKILSHTDYTSLIEIRLGFKDAETSIAGSIFGKNNPRIVHYNNIYLEVNPTGQLLIIENQDKPGVVGKIGTFLGSKNVNISNMQLGLNEASGIATAFYSVQGDVDEALLSELGKMDGIVAVNRVTL